MGMTTQLRSLNDQRRLQALDQAVLVADLYCKGMTQRAIAEKLGISRVTTGKAIAYARKLWHERLVDSIEIHRAEQLAKIDRAEAAAWESFEISKRPTIEVGTVGGKPFKKKKSNASGNPQFLAVISRQVELRAKLLGLDNPDVSVANSTPLLEVIVSTRAEAAKMLPYMDFANEVEGAVVSSSEGESNDLDN